jgi:hypothetical protein
MKISSILCASFVGVAAFAFAASGASINYNASKSNTGNMTAQPTTTCPTGQTWDTTTKACVVAAKVNNTTTRSNTQHNSMMGPQTCPTGQSWDATTGKCVAIGALNYNASKSNTGNVTAPSTGTNSSAPTH